jgi:hypothetical protein
MVQVSDMLPPVDRSETQLEHRAHHLAGAIYGTILATTVVATAGHDPETINQSLAIVAVTSAVFWMAHVYALGLAARLVVRRSLTRIEMRSIALAEWPMMQSSWPILLSLALGSLGIISREGAIDLAMLMGIGALFTYGLVMGSEERMSWSRRLLNACISGAFGVVILGMKVLVH